VPLILEDAGLGAFLVEQLGLPGVAPDLEPWRALVDGLHGRRRRIAVALVGKYTELRDAYISIVEALEHAGLANDVAIDIHWVNSEEIETWSQEEVERLLRPVSGVVVAPGFGPRGIEGKIKAARFARTREIPYLGLCYGMQMACIEVARHVCGMTGANSTEIDPMTPYPVIDIMPDQREVEDKGGTMRLGRYPCRLVAGTRVRAAYGVDEVEERHRHRFEFNNAFRARLEEAGVVFSGLSPDGRLVEIIELRDHPWFVGTQFHPEFRSRPMRPHPLFSAFVRAAAAVLHEGDQRPLPLDEVLVEMQTAG
jgi:CTP synthase